MKSKLFYFVFFTFCSCASFAQTITTRPLFSDNIKEVLLESKALNQKRVVSIYLPQSYETSKKDYPTLYLLDGERHLPHAVIATRLYQELGMVPELIIVAIENFNEDGARERDFYHEKSKFTEFIGKELVSFIDNKFRTTSESVLYGHSLAALFTIDTLAKHPHLFDKYIAAGPPLQGLERQLYLEINNQDFTADKTLYLTIASKQEEGERVYNAYVDFISLLAKQSPNSLNWQHKIMEGESHISNYYISFFHGIAEVFKSQT